MLSSAVQYDPDMIQRMQMENITAKEITETLEEYLSEYDKYLSNSAQRKYFSAFEKGLLSSLDRKTIEPIALSFLDETEVRGFQYYFKRAVWTGDALREKYQELLSEAISAPNGMICVDGSDFPKKGRESVGVYRQHCGRLGKTENCQAGVFAGYVSEKGYGLLDSRLYLPEIWFSDEYRNRAHKSQIPGDVAFQTKNEIALEMIRNACAGEKLDIEWVGCDSAFGCDHKFLAGLPEGLKYFAAIKENELVFLSWPEMTVPERPTGKNGPQFKHPRPSFPPVKVKEIAEASNIPWQTAYLGQGTKGPVYADTKCLRCVSCVTLTDHGNYVAPEAELWLYIRRYADGSIKYFISNAPGDTPRNALDRLATMRWSIEQCFAECKGYLGMTHYETRTYQGWHRHMFMVMVAHLFTIILRQAFKKTLFFNCQRQR